MFLMLKHNDSFELTVTCLFLAFCFFLLALSFAPVPSYAGLVSEDGPVETATAVACFMGAIFCLKSFILRRRLLSRTDFLLLVGAALFFFVGGEEISWGQRILGLRPVFAGSEANVQRELNIHNLQSLRYLIYFGGFLFIVITTGVMPLLSYISKRIRSLYIKVGVPIMPVSACLAMWLGFIIFVLVPQVRYGRGELFTVFYADMYAIEELREFYFAFVLAVYVFIDYFRLLTCGKPFDTDAAQMTEEPPKSFFSALRTDVSALFRDNLALVSVLLVLTLFLTPRIRLFKDYLNHTDKQIFYRDPDIVIIEGENVAASNAGYWFKDRAPLFGGKYLALYADESPENGYFFFKYEFYVETPGNYRGYFAGTPPGSTDPTPYRHQNHSPFAVFIDGIEQRGISLETSDEYEQSLQYRNYGFYLHYEYADNFYVTKLGTFYFDKGEHRIEFRIDKRSIETNQYVFYLDAVVFTPEGWEPKKLPRSLATDIFSH